MSEPIRFWKLSGAGNDFIAVTGPAPEPPVRVAWCRRALSLGADGVLALERRHGEVVLRHFNADGTRSDLCLNGSRCAARLAFALGWADGSLTLRTDAGALACRDLGDERVEVELPGGLATAPRRLSLPIEGDADAGAENQAIEGWSIEVGVPHLVVEWSDLAHLPIERLGPRLRAHPALGAAGANVDFVRFVDRGTLWLRTWERGVEGETLACGTGVVASAVVGLVSGRVASPLVAETAGGFALRLEMVPDGPEVDADPGDLTRVLGAPIRCAGDARLVATGELLAGAAAVPPRSAWEERSSAAE